MNEEGLCINGFDFKWGMTYEQVLKNFKAENLYTIPSAWGNFEIPCSDIANLKSLTCSFRAPKLERPVIQVSFELETIKPGFFENPYSPYVKHLIAILGKPHKVSKEGLKNGQKYNKGYASSNVIYNCK